MGTDPKGPLLGQGQQCRERGSCIRIIVGPNSRRTSTPDTEPHPPHARRSSTGATAHGPVSRSPGASLDLSAMRTLEPKAECSDCDRGEPTHDFYLTSSVDGLKRFRLTSLWE